MSEWAHALNLWLNDHPVKMWLPDFIIAATILLAVVVAANCLIRQPVKRLELAWAAVASLLLLLVLTATPWWPRISLVPRLESRQVTSSPPPRFVAKAPRTSPTVPSKSPLVSPSPGPGSVPSKTPKPRQAKPVTRPAFRLESVDFGTWVTGGFVIGFMFVAGWLLLGALGMQRLCRRATPAPIEVQDELKSVVGTDAELPRLLVSPSIASAAACGLRKPTILLPQHAVEAESRSILRPLLAHEWAHIQRGDLWLLALSRVVMLVLFAHPLYWLLRRRIRIDQELLADAMAAGAHGRHEYAETLLAWARRMPNPPRLQGALGIWEGRAQLSRRIAILLDERIRLGTQCSRGWRYGAGGVTLAMVLGLSLLTLRPAPAADPKPVAKNPIPVRGTERSTPPASAPAKPLNPGTASTDAPRYSPPAHPEKITITGFCLDETRKPIPGARVKLFRIDRATTSASLRVPTMRLEYLIPPSWGVKTKPLFTSIFEEEYFDPQSQRLLQEVNTDEDGHYRFAALPFDLAWLQQHSRVQVVVQARGKATEVVTTFPPHSPNIHWAPPPFDKEPLPYGTELYTSVLHDASTLRGRITDAEGQPVVGAEVSCVGGLYSPVTGILCAVTDEEGRYEIANHQPWGLMPPSLDHSGLVVSPAAFVAQVRHRGYATQYLEFTTLPAEVNGVLQRPAAIHGQVVNDTTGQPIAGVSLALERDGRTVDFSATDAHGCYKCRDLSPGTYTIHASSEQFPLLKQQFELQVGENTCDLRMKPGGVLKGRVVDQATGRVPTKPDVSWAGRQVRETTGKVLDDLDLGMMVAAFAPGETLITGNHTRVQPDGTFSLPVRPGAAQVRVFGTSEWRLLDAQRWEQAGVTVAAGETVEVELVMVPQQPALEFTVTKPLDERGVIALLKNPDYTESKVETEIIDGQEHVTVIGLESADFQGKALLPQLAFVQENLLANIQQLPKLRALALQGGDQALAKLRGVESLESLDIEGENVTETGLAYLATLPNLKELRIYAPQDEALRQVLRLTKLEGLDIRGEFTDAGLAPLQKMDHLTQLSIAPMGSSTLTDKTLETVGKLPRLTDLEISNGDETGKWVVTNEGLRQLAGLKNLEMLSLEVVVDQMTDTGFDSLAEMDRLTELTIGLSGPSQLTDKALEPIGKLTQLKLLSLGSALSKTDTWIITDDGLRLLAGLTNLENLFITVSGDKITDAGLVHMRGLKNLRRFHVASKSVTEAGMQELRQAIPELKDLDLQAAPTAKTPPLPPHNPPPKAAPNATEAPAPEKAKPTTTDKLTIRGKCLDTDGKPIDGAHLRLVRLNLRPFDDWARPMCRIKIIPSGNDKAATDDNDQLSTVGANYSVTILHGNRQPDADGAFTFADVPMDEALRTRQAHLMVIVQAPGIASEGRPLYCDPGIGPEAQPLEFTLWPAATLMGRVTNAAGEPVAGAVISIPEMSFVGEPIPDYMCAVTDADGQYKITDLGSFDVLQFPPELTPFGAMVVTSHALCVEHPAYAHQFGEFTKIPGVVNVVLHAPAALRGQVVQDEDGRAIAEATVHWSRPGGLSGAQRTDANGRYSLARLQAGKCIVKVERPDRPPVSHTIELQAGDNVLDARMQPGGTIRGRVVDDATGKPPEMMGSNGNGALVAVQRSGDDPKKDTFTGQIHYGGSFSLAVRPGLNHLTLTSLPEGRWRLVDAERWEKTGVDVAPGQTVEIELRVVEKKQPEVMMVPGMGGLVPVQPLTFDQLMATLNDTLLAELTTKTIDGQEYITEIDFSPSGGGPADEEFALAEVIWLQQSLLAHLDKFPKLRRMMVFGPPDGDAALAALHGHQSLEELEMGPISRITAAGWTHLATLSQLKKLSVYCLEVKFDAQALGQIARLSKLEELAIVGAFTDEGLRPLGNLTKLKALELGSDQLTDGGLVHLQELKHLKSLRLQGTKVTRAGVEKLQQSIPELKVSGYAGEPKADPPPSVPSP